MNFTLLTMDGTGLGIGKLLEKESQNVNFVSLLSNDKFSGILERSKELDKTAYHIVLTKGFGTVATKMIEDGIKVFGSSKWTESLGTKKELGISTAFECGLLVPKVTVLHSQNELNVFSQENEGKDFLLVTNEDPIIIYDMSNISDGMQLEFEAWWNGDKWQFLNVGLSNRFVGNGDLGGCLESNLNLVWSIGESVNHPIKRYYKKLGTILKREAPEFRGVIRISVIAYKSRYYYLDFHTTFRYDAIYCLTELFQEPFYEIIRKMVEGKEVSPLSPSNFGVSLKLMMLSHPAVQSLPYYGQIIEPSENGKTTFWFEDVMRVDNSYACAGISGFIGTLTSKGTTIKKAWEDVYKAAEKFDFFDLYYRTDASSTMCREYNEAKYRRYA